LFINWLSYKCTGESFSVLFFILLIKNTGKDSFILSVFLIRYKNVFDLIKAAKLADLKGFKYVIKTISSLLFGLLYNLFRP
jgi:hypothetical protein